MNTLQELQELERKQQELKNKKRNPVLGTAEKGLDILGSAGGGSLLTAPFRLLKTIKDNAKKIYGGLSAPERARKQAELKQAVAFKKKQLGDQMKAQAQAQAQAQKLKQKQQLAMEKGRTKEIQNQFKQNVAKGTPEQAMKTLFPTSYRKQPTGIQSPMIPKPGAKFQVNKTGPNGTTTPVTLKRPKPRMTKQRKMNQKIGQGLANPVNYENKIKNVMGVN